MTLATEPEAAAALGVAGASGPAPGRRRRVGTGGRIAAGAAVGAVLFAAGAFGLTRSSSDDDRARPNVPPPVGVAAVEAGPRTNESLSDLIARLQDHLTDAPDDAASWATLGLAYVQQAKLTVDPTFYQLADGALARSLEVDGEQNFIAYTGLSALASARHEFTDAKTFAEQGLAINEYNARLYGALSDAELQLGNYDAAFDAVQQMLDLSPDTASLARASYTWELRGDVEQATALMQRALDDAPTPADEAFALVHLGGLAFDAGDPNAALGHYIAALDASPNDAAALAGRARAEAAVGQLETALDHYAEVVARAPEPGYIAEYADLLRSVGRPAEAEQQDELFANVQSLYEAAGVQPDATAVLFLADHGDPAAAVAAAEATLAANPFVTTHDAYAWALHKAGRDVEALAAIDRALVLGTRNALFHYHAGVIKLAFGDDDGARAELQTALAINPFFHPIAARDAERMLAELGDA